MPRFQRKGDANGGVATRGRSRTHGTLVAIAGGIIAAGLALPFVVGDRTDDFAGGGLEVGDAASPVTSAPTTTQLDAAGEDVAAGDAGGPVAANPSGGASRGAGPSPVASSPSGGGTATLTASDRGVSPSAIKVGFLLLDIATVGRLGVDVAIDPEQQQAAIQAYVDDINERGGIHGRRIEPVFRTYDVVSENDQQEACLALTQDAKVFAILVGFNLPNPTLCIVEQNQTPLFNNVSNNPDWLIERAQGRLVTAFAGSGRMMRAWVAELDRLGALAGKKLGILSDDQTDPNGRVARQLEQVLTERGHVVARRGQLSADLQTSASQVPVEVNQFQAAGVQVALFLTGNTVRGTQFVQQADAQGYRPAYTVTDWSSNFTDSGSANMPRAFDGSIGITATRNNEFRANRPEPALATACRTTYEARTRRALGARGGNEYGLTMNICDLIRWFHAAAVAAGPNLTRAGLTAGVESLGAMTSASWGNGQFGRGKLDMNDEIRRIRWAFDCKCWQPVDDFHRPG